MLVDYFKSGWKEYTSHESNTGGMISQSYIYNNTRGTFSAALRHLSGSDSVRVQRESSQNYFRVYTQETGIVTDSVLSDPDLNFYEIEVVQDMMDFQELIQINANKIISNLSIEKVLISEDGRRIITEAGRTIILE